jgi:hypothetical protein
VAHVIQRCWEPNPVARPSFAFVMGQLELILKDHQHRTATVTASMVY